MFRSSSTLIHTLLLAGLVAIAPAEVTFFTEFEGGNGTAFNEVEPNLWEWEIEPDTNSTDRQWFQFEVRGAAGQTLTLRLLNTDKTNVTSHWATAWPVYSLDGGSTWARIPGERSHTDTTWTFVHEFTTGAEQIAFHDPYPFSLVQRKFPEWAAHPHVTGKVLGKSVEGRDIAHFLVTDPDHIPEGGKAGIWIIARQHSAEVPGSFTMETFFDFLLSEDDVARALRANAVFNIVPFVNPDGAHAGNYRDNAKGVNLNRVWDGTATMEESPEVYLVKQEIDAWVAAGHDYRMFLDLHATSSARPYFAFHPSAEIISEEMDRDITRFLKLVESRAPHFNPEAGETSSNNRALAYHDQRQAHGVIALTYEGTYNHENYGPTPTAPTTPAGHRLVGVATAHAIAELYGFQPPE